jgi:CheY-like chemotaxis protein
MDAYLSKPIRLDTLAETLQSTLRQLHLSENEDAMG